MFAGPVQICHHVGAPSTSSITPNRMLFGGFGLAYFLGWLHIGSQNFMKEESWPSRKSHARPPTSDPKMTP